MEDAEDQTGMRAAIFEQPALQQYMGSLFQALLEAPPQHQSAIHLVVEARTVSRQTSVLFTFGSPELPGQYSTLVPDAIASAAFQVLATLLREDERAPGFEVLLHKTGATQWATEFHRLDEPGPQWADLPRLAIRVCGYGFSLAPPRDVVFRWARNLSPPAIIAAAKTGADHSFQRVQITFTEAGPRMLPGEGVTQAHEVIEVAEGPGTDAWMIETPAFHAVWPAGLDLRSPLASNTRFDLLWPDNSIVFVQGPAPKGTILDEMMAEGQTALGRGRTPSGHDWIDLSYEAAGSEWRQRHYLRVLSERAFIVTAQCLPPLTQQVLPLSDELTDSLRAPTA